MKIEFYINVHEDMMATRDQHSDHYRPSQHL